MRPKRSLRILFCFSLLVVALSYLPILPAFFVADDYRVYSPEFLANPFKYFTQQLWPDIPTSTYLRPLPALTFAFDDLLRGEGTIVPHLTTLLLHLTRIFHE